MARTPRKRTITPWTTGDLKALRQLAGRASVSKIARQLKRSADAVYQKASLLGVSPRPR